MVEYSPFPHMIVSQSPMMSHLHLYNSLTAIIYGSHTQLSTKNNTEEQMPEFLQNEVRDAINKIKKIDKE